jgi:hypothetical protein
MVTSVAYFHEVVPRLHYCNLNYIGLVYSIIIGEYNCSNAARTSIEMQLMAKMSTIFLQ